MSQTESQNIDVGASSSSSNATQSTATTVPRVVRYAYRNFYVFGAKWNATCVKCDKKLKDSTGVTTAFTK